MTSGSSLLLPWVFLLARDGAELRPDLTFGEWKADSPLPGCGYTCSACSGHIHQSCGSHSGPQNAREQLPLSFSEHLLLEKFKVHPKTNIKDPHIPSPASAVLNSGPGPFHPNHNTVSHLKN